MTPTIVWFRQDLRLTDHRALVAAIQSGGPTYPVYVLDDATAGEWAMGGAQRWWLHASLTSLDAQLRGRGSRLTLRRGPTIETLLRLADETGARSIHLTRAYEPYAAGLEISLQSACQRAGLAIHRYGGSLLHEPETIRTRTGEPFRVFTPFWRALSSAPPPRPTLTAPTSLAAPETWPASDPLDAWCLQPHRPDWAGGLRASWEPGEAGAARRLDALIDAALRGYAEGRDRPDRTGTSMLSPHLHFGEIGPVQCWHAVEAARQGDATLTAGAASFLRELGWREFSYHLLHHWPAITERAFRPQFDRFPYDDNHERVKAGFEAWTRGRTGYPIVDAGMRQLWETGWMHNRVRMIVASFLTKHLLLPWQTGAGWFWDTLVDADLASNSASWQWVAGSGADAAPYFRVFNPIVQGQKFDPDGAYVRRFVPELAALPSAHVHAPWLAPESALAAAGIRLGDSYPLPVIEHHVARHRALSAYAALRAQTTEETSA